MTSHEKHRYIQAYSRIIGVAEEKVTEYADKKGMAALVNNAAQLLKTPTQRKKHQAFLDLYRMSSTLKQKNPILDSPAETAKFVRSVMDKIHDKEAFIVVFVDVQNRVIDYEEVSVGSLAGTSVHPREVFRNAIVNKAYAIIIGHNHPSGDVTPSKVDVEATKALKETGKILRIPVIDHVIVNGLNHYDFYSFRDTGVLEEQAYYRMSSEQTIDDLER
jgi:DNA repair protein RadC